LGATGGTLDKLDSISGFRTDLSMDQMQQVCASVGCVISGSTEGLVPADRKLYALRDVTATVPSIPLITASIMSKKLAEGLDALVLDVKFGTGAFMKTADQARQLAHSMVATGQRMNVATTALLTDMNQPLGRMVGNAVEVNESVAALEGHGPDDLMEITLELGAELLVSTGRAVSLSQARADLQQTIDSGAAREKFAQMVAAQGGDLEAPRTVAPPQEVKSPATGYVTHIDAEQLGQAIITMKGGRSQLGDPLDYSTGLEMLIRLGQQVETGQPLVRLFAPASQVEQVTAILHSAIVLGPEKCEAPPLMLDRIAE
jgi:pyrimidine-nucleoside phosphorylase